MTLLYKIRLVAALMLVLFACSDSTQLPDPNFIPKNQVKHFAPGNSPVVFIDAAHHNFLTAKGLYRPFAEVLISAGYTVTTSKKAISLQHLAGADILVIANALDKNRRDWTPPFNDALTPSEVASIKQWVLQGGALFLVADHAPFPRVIEPLAQEFGFKFSHGHVGNAVFRRSNQTLAEHVTTYKSSEPKQPGYMANSITGLAGTGVFDPQIEQVHTFGGSAFKAPENAVSLLTLGKRAVSIVPDVPFQVDTDTPRVSMHGWSQGALLQVGKGRVAVFAEGMMFSSQLDSKTGQKYGFTSPGAEQNQQFLLNVMGWLVAAS